MRWLKSTLYTLAFLQVLKLAATTPLANPTDDVADSLRYQKDEKLDEVVVTASRTPRFHKDLPVLTQVIPQRQIQLIEPRSFNEILEYTLPGVEFGKHGGQDQLSYRGFDASSLLFLIDGELITTGSSSSIDFDRINPDDIERIEIIRGAASALYGSNALAGVVNIITKSSRRPFYASALASANVATRGKESLFGQRYHANVAFNRAGFGSNTSLGFHRIPGFSLRNEEGQAVNRLFDTDNIHIAQKLCYRPSEQVAIRGGVNYNHRIQKKDEFLNNHFGALDATAGAVWVINPESSLDFSYHYSNFRRDSILPKVIDGTHRRPVFNENLHHLRLQYNLDIEERHRLNFGGEYINDKISSPRLASSSSPEAKLMHTGILYGQYSFEPYEQLALNYGGRLDMRNNFGVHYTNRLTARYRPISPLVLRATFAQGYRTPSMQELYFYFDHMGMFFITGNEKLKPEKSNMFLLSAEYSLAKISLNANAFYNFVKDRITLIDVSGNYQYGNAPSDKRNKIFGFDFNLRATLPYGFSLSGSYAYTYDYYPLVSKNGEILYDNNQKPALATTTRPHSAVGMLAWQRRFTDNYALSASFAIRFLSGFKSAVRVGDNDWKYHYYNAATIAKIGLSQRLYKWVDLYIGIDNLFAYQPNRVAFNTPLTPGRTYLCNLRFTW